MTGSLPFPYITTVEVAFRDLDAMGHVNNAVYLSYLENARIKYLVGLLELNGLGNMPLIMAEAQISYKAPAFFGEQLTVGTGVSRFGVKSFDMLYRITGGDGRLVVLAKTVQVAYDYAAGTTISVPDALKARILAFQSGWQPPEGQR
jgi:acyl-CoA thioester hydrolase